MAAVAASAGTASALEFRPSFELVESKSGAGSQRIRVTVRTENYYPFKKWLPFIDWGMFARTSLEYGYIRSHSVRICFACFSTDGSFEETSPLKTVFTIPGSKRAELIEVLKQKGFIQRNAFLFAKF
jgi:hypothetical protein